MSVSKRNFIAAISTSLSVIAIAAIIVGAKFGQESTHQAVRDIDEDSRPAIAPVAPEASFYDAPATPTPVNTAQTVASSSPTVAVAKPSEPVITAAAYLVGNVLTGKIYLEKNDAKVLPVASMSKLITAIAATDTFTPTTTIMVTEQETEVASDTSMLVSGEIFTVDELLYPLLLNSSNVAAEALASSSDRTKFLELMSSYAWEVGMPSTFFADPSGISPRNISTAKDFFALAQYLYKNRPDILAITRTPNLSLATTTSHNGHEFVSIHPFITDREFLGGKTGHTTEAGDTMLTIMMIDGQPIAVIVLDSNTGGRAGDTQLLIDDYKKALLN